MISTPRSAVVSWASTINPWLCVLTVLVFLILETSLLVGLVVPGEVTLLLRAVRANRRSSEQEHPHVVGEPPPT